MDTEGKSSAPGALALVQDFVNTNDVETKDDAWVNAAGLRLWLSSREMLSEDEPVSDEDLRRARGVREALRALLLANNGAPLDARSVAMLNHVAAGARLVVRFERDGHAQLEPVPSGVDGALGRLLAIVNTSMTDGTWPRLKACRNDTCRWVFYDRSKNRSGTWCTMAVCGSRIKARAYRQRRQHKGT